MILGHARFSSQGMANGTVLEEGGREGRPKLGGCWTSAKLSQSVGSPGLGGNLMCQSPTNFCLKHPLLIPSQGPESMVSRQEVKPTSPEPWGKHLSLEEGEDGAAPGQRATGRTFPGAWLEGAIKDDHSSAWPSALSKSQTPAQGARPAHLSPAAPCSGFCCACSGALCRGCGFQGSGMPLPRGELHFFEQPLQKGLPACHILTLESLPTRLWPETCHLSQLLHRSPLTPFGAATINPLTSWVLSNIIS